MTASNPPSIGRIVHYVPNDRLDEALPCRAAIIIEVWFNDPDLSDPSESVALCELKLDGMSFHRYVEHSEPIHRRGTWHWPERV